MTFTAKDKQEMKEAGKVVINKTKDWLGLLGVCLILLKVLGFTDLSWWWVTAPFWGPFAFVLAGLSAVLLFIVLGTVVTWLINEYEFRKKKKK